MAAVEIRIVGVHLSGASVRRSAAVRSSCVLTQARTGLELGPAHSRIADALFRWRGVEAVAGEEDPSSASPLFWEAYSPEIGATPSKDSDARLKEAIADLGAADLYCIDAPLTPPPLLCCAAGTEDSAKAVEALWRLWETQRTEGRKIRAPQPYVDRWFENYARQRFEAARLEHGFEFEAPFSSNRAPISARAMWLKRELRARFPRALVLETHSIAAAVGWSTAAGYKGLASVALKHGHDGHGARAGLLRRLEVQHYATRSAGLHHELFEGLAASAEVFFASMAALSAWGFLTGRAFVDAEFASLEEADPLAGWALLPRELDEQEMRL